IQEVEVKTGGYQAEYGRNTGGVINVVTKSGGNEFHGDLFGYYNSPGMSANERFDTTTGYSQTGDAVNVSSTGGAISVFTPHDRREGGVDVGGYFLKDRIWFYGAYDRTLTDDKREPVSGSLQGQRFNRRFVNNLWAGKLTFNVVQGTRFVATAF